MQYLLEMLVIDCWFSIQGGMKLKSLFVLLKTFITKRFYVLGYVETGMASIKYATIITPWRKVLENINK